MFRTVHYEHMMFLSIMYRHTRDFFSKGMSINPSINVYSARYTGIHWGCVGIYIIGILGFTLYLLLHYTKTYIDTI